MSEHVVQRRGDGEELDVLGERIRILADAAVTGGQFVVFEEVTQPGGGPPLHRHSREDEFFYVVAGTVKFVLDGVESAVPAGGSVLAQRGSVHTFVNAGSAASRMVILCCPAGLEEAFREADRLGREGRATPTAIMMALRRAGVEVVGPPLGERR